MCTILSQIRKGFKGKDKGDPGGKGPQANATGSGESMYPQGQEQQQHVEQGRENGSNTPAQYEQGWGEQQTDWYETDWSSGAWYKFAEL